VKLKVYVDVFGRIGICEIFPATEANAGLNEMLKDLVKEEFYGDRYAEFNPGFYTAQFEIDNDDGEDCYMQIEKIFK
jgi:hypothetical protein